MLFSQEPCPPSLNCPSGVKYPFKLCPYLIETDGRVRTICAEDPHNIPGLDWPYCLQMAELPICLEPLDFPSNEQIPFGNLIFDEYQANIDLNKAVYEWNCICGKQNDGCGSGCIIDIYFSENEDYFDDGVLALANANYSLYFCQVQCHNSFIMLNNTEKI